MHLITSIGVIDTTKQLHKDFTHRALEQMLHTQSVLTCALWNENQPELINIAVNNVNRIIKDILHLDKTS